MPSNPFARGAPPSGVPNAFARMTAYQPTLRDRAATGLLGILGSGPTAQHFTEGLLGSTGLGQTRAGLLDFSPVGAAFAADQGGRQIAHGHPVAGAANVFLAAAPLPGAVKSGAKEIRAAEHIPEQLYHGSPVSDLAGLKPVKQPGTYDFPAVVSLTTDPKFAQRYAGDGGRVYEAKATARNVGDFRKPADVKRVADWYAKNYGPLDAYDMEALQHGAWRLWENPQLWREHGWEGAWVREEPGSGPSDVLNLSLASGKGVALK